MDLKDPERIWMSKTEALAYVQRVYHGSRCGAMIRTCGWPSAW